MTRENPIITKMLTPQKLGQLFKEIIEAIDKTGLLKKQHKTYVNLRYKGDIYQFWAEWKERSVKGKQVPYKRVQTFFQVTDPILLATINTDFSEVCVSADLSVFVP